MRSGSEFCMFDRFFQKLGIFAVHEDFDISYMPLGVLLLVFGWLSFSLLSFGGNLPLGVAFLFT